MHKPCGCGNRQGRVVAVTLRALLEFDLKIFLVSTSIVQFDVERAFSLAGTRRKLRCKFFFRSRWPHLDLSIGRGDAGKPAFDIRGLRRNLVAETDKSFKHNEFIT